MARVTSSCRPPTLLRPRGGLCVGPVLRAAAGGAPAWSPADEAGLWTGWLDPSDSATLWADTAATTAASVDGAVARIDDKSGNARNLTQATAGARPLWKSSSGVHFLQFDGIDDVIAGVAASNFFAAGAREIIIGLKFRTITTEQPSFANNSALGGGNGYWSIVARTNNGGEIGSYNWDGNADMAYVAYTANTAAVVVSRLAGGSIRTAINGGTETAVASGNTAVLNGELWLGKSGVQPAAAVDLYGALFVNTDIGTTIRDKAVAWMAAKSGVTL